MKKFEYIQYDIIGTKTEQTLSLPEECNIYEIGWISLNKSYLLISPVKVGGFKQIGELYYNRIENVQITNSELPIKDIDISPKFNNVYSVQYDYSNKIVSVAKFKKLKYNGIEVLTMTFKDEEVVEAMLHTIRYDNLYFQNFDSNPKAIKMFRDGITKLYNIAINE